MAEGMICGHCGATDVGSPAAGYARGAITTATGVVGATLCHPNETGRPDCYRLVTVYRHNMPCRICPPALNKPRPAPAVGSHQLVDVIEIAPDGVTSTRPGSGCSATPGLSHSAGLPQISTSLYEPRRTAMQPDQPTPDQLAGFDQTLAALSANLDLLIDMYRAELADGQHPDISLAGLAEWLRANHDVAELAEHLAAAVRRLVEAHAAPAAAYHDGYDDGVRQGRRQATEGWEREWSVRYEPDGYVHGGKFTEAGAKARAAELDGTVVSRLVGPWETAEQPDPCCDLHGRNCEQGGEECCWRCTEAYHFRIGHGGVPCSNPDLSGDDAAEQPKPARGDG